MSIPTTDSRMLKIAVRRPWRMALSVAAAGLLLAVAPASALANPTMAPFRVAQLDSGQPAGEAKPTATLNWAESMFSELEHDFGNVAAGAEVRHELTLTNPYEEVVRIVGVDKTCGCTEAKVSQYEIGTHEKVTIEVAMDTRKFRDEKRSNVIVTLAFTAADGRVAQETVRVPIRAFIRKDVVIEPGSANFGIVESGAAKERLLTVKYAGRPDWSITGVDSSNPHITPTLGSRTPVPGGVQYQLTVALDPGAPIGEVTDRLLLRTNDGVNQAVPVMVKATVEPDIVATPSRLPLGKLAPGQQKRMTVVLRGKRPFEIENFVCLNHEGVFTVPQLAGNKTIHVIPITVSAPEKTGSLDETFEVSVVGRDEPITFEAYGEVQ